MLVWFFSDILVFKQEETNVKSETEKQAEIDVKRGYMADCVKDCHNYETQKEAGWITQDLVQRKLSFHYGAPEDLFSFIPF